MLGKKQIEKIAEIIKAVSMPEAVYLFGSYAKNQANEKSDLDLAIIKKNIEDKHKELYQIRKSLMSCYVPMDLVMIEQSEFNANKSRKGTVYYEISTKGKKIA